MDKMLDLPNLSSGNSFTDKPLARLHRFYLSGEVKNSEEYTSWFETIRGAGEQDVIYIHINSMGGDLFTAIQFMRVFSETKAMVVASAEGACMSAATIPFMCAKHWEISKHSMFMFHNYSWGTMGKGGEMYDQVAHGRKWSEKLMRDIYSGFLTDEEITSILENKDIWMSGEEVATRLNSRAQAAKEKAEKRTQNKKISSKNAIKSKKIK